MSNAFNYSYSPSENKELNSIRSKYIPRSESKMDELRALDRRVRKPAKVFAYTFGSVSAVIMGAGMSLVMSDIGSMMGMKETMAPGITIGIVGLVLAIANYPIYKSILSSRRKKYADRILALSEEITKTES